MKRNLDEIQRKYSKAIKMKFPSLDSASFYAKCISTYENWFKNTSNSLKVSGDYENLMDKFSLQRKTVRAYVALCERYGYLEGVKLF